MKISADKDANNLSELRLLEVRMADAASRMRAILKEVEDIAEEIDKL